MNIGTILTILSSSGIFSLICRYIFKRIKANDDKTKAVAMGVQALLRDRLIEKYDYYSDKGYAPIYAKDNFENMWKQYHELGVNGVMDEIHEKFKDLPDKEEKKREN